MRFEGAVFRCASMLEATIFVNIWTYGNSEFVPAGPPAANAVRAPRLRPSRVSKNMDPEPCFMELTTSSAC